MEDQRRSDRKEGKKPTYGSLDEQKLKQEIRKQRKESNSSFEEKGSSRPPSTQSVPFEEPVVPIYENIKISGTNQSSTKGTQGETPSYGESEIQKDHIQVQFKNSALQVNESENSLNESQSKICISGNLLFPDLSSLPRSGTYRRPIHQLPLGIFEIRN